MLAWRSATTTGSRLTPGCTAGYRRAPPIRSAGACVRSESLPQSPSAISNLLRARAVDRLPELLARVAEEERKRCERRHSIDVPPDGA